MRCYICQESKRAYRRINNPRRGICRSCYQNTRIFLRNLISEREEERVHWQQVINSANEEEAENEYRRTHNGEEPPDDWTPQERRQVEGNETPQPEQRRRNLRKIQLKTPDEILEEKLEHLDFDDLLESEKTN